MHSAPSVHYPVGRSAFWGLVLCAIWASGALLVSVWCYTNGSIGWRQWLGLFALVGAGGVAAAGWWRTPVGTLGWDGQQWLWTAHHHGAARYEPGGVAVALDLQQHMLLVLRTGRGLPLWLTVEQVTLPARWQDLRRAVYSRASTAAPMATPPGPEPAPSHSLHDRHP